MLGQDETAATSRIESNKKINLHISVFPGFRCLIMDIVGNDLMYNGTQMETVNFIDISARYDIQLIGK